MGDMAEDFRLLNEHNKQRKKHNLKKAQAIRARFTIHTEWHWSLWLEGSRLQYWPSSNKWRWRDKTCYGTPDSLLGFIKNRDTP